MGRFVTAGDCKIRTQWAVLCVVTPESVFETLIIFLAWDALQRSQYVLKLSTRRRMFDFFFFKQYHVFVWCVDPHLALSPCLIVLSSVIHGALPRGSVVMFRLLLPWERWKIVNANEITLNSSVFVYVVNCYFKLAVLNEEAYWGFRAFRDVTYIHRITAEMTSYHSVC